MKRVLLVAFHYPPYKGSSGLQRTLSFSRQLQDFGWQPSVLTARVAAYDRTSDDQLADIPPDVEVVRTLALDAARHLAIRGKHLARLAMPDRWKTWSLTALPAGLRLVRRLGIKALWSTYPISTAHRIGAELARHTGLPWIADFRDPMVEQDPRSGCWAPSDPALRASRLAIESSCADRATRLVFCAAGARDIVLARYPTLAVDRCAIVTNGYDEQAFLEASKLAVPAQFSYRRVLLHSGTLYLGEDRDPTHLFAAVRHLLDSGELTGQTIELRLRNPSNENELRELARKSGITEIVSILPALPYRQALAEMLSSDGLLLMQGITSNPAIPAKLYEYLRAKKPIIALVHPEGDTARTLKEVGLNRFASPVDTDGIRGLLRLWLQQGTETKLRPSNSEAALSFSRRESARRLAALLDAVTAL